jgi:putative monooxygenase ydhR
MAEKILQIQFGLNVTPSEYKQIAGAVAESFAKVPGLRWKIWILDEQKREAGGVYLFEDQRALEAFAASDLAKTVATHPALKNVTMRASDVMPEETAVTRGPIGATVHA